MSRNDSAPNAPDAAPPASLLATERAALVRSEAARLGFDAVGFARADVPLDVEHERYTAFVEAGFHGELGYLADDLEARRRVDHEAVLPGAKTMIVVARRYARSAAEEASDPEVAKLIARYARGQDYHNHLRKKVRRLAAFVRKLDVGVVARPLLDVEPVLERAWAARAGVGFIGKNGLVLRPGMGSYVLLGEVATTLALTEDAPMFERCGSCTACLDACPTDAFVAPYVLDARRCISYFTIEKPGAADASLLDAAGDRLFGCDACQSVCPFNKTSPPGSESTRAFAPLARWAAVALADLVTEDDAAFLALTEGSPLYRPGRRGLAGQAVRVARRWLTDPDARRRADAQATLNKAARLGLV